MDLKDRRHQEDLSHFKDDALNKLDDLIKDFMSSNDDSIYKKAAILSYWLNDYTDYLKQERTFSPTYLPTFRQGDIIEVNLGYRIGTEFGGKHFAMVLDKVCKRNYSTITIVPLSSKKEHKKVSLPNVDLGDSLYKTLTNKFLNDYVENKKLLEKSLKVLAALETVASDETTLFKLLSIIDPRFEGKGVDDINLMATQDNKKSLYLDKRISETMGRIENIKMGSIVKLNHVITISKMRITDPLRKTDSLYGIRLPQEDIDLVINKFKSMYLT